MIKFRNGLNVDLNFKQTTIFIIDGKVIEKSGRVHSFSEFFNSVEGNFYASVDDLSLLISIFLTSLYNFPTESLLDCLSKYIKTVGLIKDKNYYNIDLKRFESIQPIEIKTPPFEYLYGDYLAGGVKIDFFEQVENLCCAHFIYMNCGALSALVTSSFGLGECISDSAEKVFSDVITNPKSVISLLNHEYLDILRDEFVPVLDHKVEDPRRIANYLLEKYGESFLKDLWNRLIKKRLPAFIHKKDPDFLEKIFYLRSKSIRDKHYDKFISDELGLRFSIYYSNTPDFRNFYNRNLIKFFHSSTQKWKLR